jgi:hypothetical protein
VNDGPESSALDRRAPRAAVDASQPRGREAVGISGAVTSVWETEGPNQELSMALSHFTQEVRSIRGNRAHYL